jgi:lipid-A-disaccharide synthase-like uncharacterized protein
MTSPLWWLGTLGMIAIEGSYLPQIGRLFRLKHAEDISVLFPSLNLAGRLLALSYALSAHESVFTLGFLVGAVLRLTLLSQVLWYRYLKPGTDRRADVATPLLREELVR